MQDKPFWLEVTTALLLPAAIGFFTVMSSCSEARHREATILLSLIDRAVQDPENLSRYAISLKQHNLINDEQLNTVMAQAVGSPDADVARRNLEEARRQSSSLPPGSKVAQSIENALDGIPPRVYFHIARKEQQDRASDVRASLEAQGFVVPGIEFTGAKSPSNTQLRFFRSSEQSEAEQIIKALAEDGVTNVDQVDLSRRYETSTKIRQRHYELWFGRDDKSDLS